MYLQYINGSSVAKKNCGWLGHIRYTLEYSVQRFVDAFLELKMTSVFSHNHH